MKQYIILIFLTNALYLSAASQLVTVRHSVNHGAPDVFGLLKVTDIEVKEVKQVDILSDFRKKKDAAPSLAEKIEELKKQCPRLPAPKASLHLEGKRSDNTLVALKWDRKNGFNDRLYNIERSLGDSSHFEVVNLVWAAAQEKTHEKYRLADGNDYSEVSYYRLRLIENNDIFTYSNVVEVDGYKTQKFTLFPNPARDMVTLRLVTKVAGISQITIYDASGRMLKQQNQMLFQGSNSHNVSVADLSGGTYLVHVVLADKTTTTAKLIKTAQ